ncbi:MAG TPA: competence protein TfoX, partial [Afipia sp.]|nr:competence protein TfoX [Afipia sp.]
PRKWGTAKKAKPPAAKKAALKTAGRKTSPKRLLVKKR